MREYYVPGVGEKDTDKIIRSLGQAHEKTATNTDDIAALQAAASDYLTKTGNLAGLNSTSTSQTNLGGTTVGKAVFTAANTRAARLAFNGCAPDVVIEDRKTTGIAGGGLTGSTNNVRTLNTLARNDGTLASLSSDQFTLPAGSYYIKWSAPAWRVDQHQANLSNVTDSAFVTGGTPEYSPSSTDSSQTRSVGAAFVTIADSKAFSILHTCLTTRASNGAGLAMNVGTIEIYTRVEIWRLA